MEIESDKDVMTEETEKEGSFIQDFFCARNILETALRHWRIVAICTVLGAIVSFALSRWVIQPVYHSTASVFSWRSSSEEYTSVRQNMDPTRDLSAALMLISDYRELLKSNAMRRKINDSIMSQYHVDPMQRENARRFWYDLRIDTGRETRMLYITASAHTPELAKFVANETSLLFGDLISEIFAFNNIRVIDVATMPKAAQNVSLRRNLPIGCVCGLFFGVAVAVILGLLDQTIRDPEQAVKYLEHPIMTTVPNITDSTLQQETLLSKLDKNQELAESLRMLRANLPYFAVKSDAGGSCRVFLATSTIPHEGKSNCTSALAEITAKANKRVLLIDADQRKPRLHRIFNLNTSKGFATVLAGEATIQDVLTKVNPWLDVVPCGPMPPNPSELLMSSNLEKIIASERNNYDYIFIDSPPTLFLTDPLLIAPFVDAVLYVVACGFARIGLIRKTLRMIHQVVGKKPVGIVVNRFDKRKSVSSYGYSYSYSYSSKYYRHYYSADGEKSKDEKD